jgi:hypothetical protein
LDYIAQLLANRKYNHNPPTPIIQAKQKETSQKQANIGKIKQKLTKDR